VLMLPWRKFIAASIAAAFFGVLATSAMADCAADIAKIEPDLTKVVDATKKAAVEKQLNKAKHAVTQKNEKKCSKQDQEGGRNQLDAPDDESSADPCTVPYWTKVQLRPVAPSGSPSGGASLMAHHARCRCRRSSHDGEKTAEQSAAMVRERLFRRSLYHSTAKYRRPVFRPSLFAANVPRRYSMSPFRRSAPATVALQLVHRTPSGPARRISSRSRVWLGRNISQSSPAPSLYRLQMGASRIRVAMRAVPSHRPPDAPTFGG
jgi:hypothetical protein